MINMQSLSLSSLGARRMLKQCVQMETLVKNGDRRALSELLDIRTRSHWEGSLWLDISVSSTDSTYTVRTV